MTKVAPSDTPSRRHAIGGPRTVPPWGQVLAISAVYFGSAKLGLTMAFAAEQVTVVWPPTGIALAALLLFGTRLWPGITLGAFLANATTHAPLPVALGISLGNTLEAVTANGLLRRFVRLDPRLQRLRDVLGLVLLSAGLSTALSATIGVTSLCLGKVQPWGAYGSLWWVWWLGDATSDLVIAPIFLTWLTRRRSHWPARRLAEAGALLLTLVAVMLAIFGGQSVCRIPTNPLVYAVFPFVIWAALRFGQPGATAATLVASAIAIAGTANGVGPFAKETVNESLILIQLFMAVVAVTGLLLGAAIAETRRGERRASAQYETARILAESRSQEDALRGVLEALCRNLGWDVAAIWSVDREEDVLHLVELWSNPSLLVPEFEAESRGRRFPRGVSLPGRVWASAQPLGLADVLDDTNFPRIAAAAKDGLRGALAVPIVFGEEFLGVMEFFSREVRPPDADLLETTAALGRQIGQFLERKRAEQALRESEARKTAIAETALDCIITIDQEGRIVEFNPAAERTFGYRREDVLGQPMADLIIPPGLRDHHHRSLARHLATGETSVLGRRVEMPALRADGVEIPVELAIARIATEGPPMFTAYVRDISERRRATDALRESEAKLQAILDNAPACVFAKDFQGRYIIANRSFIALFGWPGPERVLGRTDRELHGGEMGDAYLAHDRLVLEAGRPLEFEELAELPEGPRTYLVLKFLLRDHAGNAYGVCGIATDITDRKEAEERLKEADRRKDEFLAMLAHELRNPLSAISNAAGLTRNSHISEEDRRWSQEVVERQVKHLARLIDDLLEVSRITRGKIALRKEHLDARQVLARAIDSVRPLIQERRHTLDVALTPGALPLRADPMRVEQMVANLLTNAAKYTEAGGQIWLSAWHEGGQIVIKVKDTGIGIPPEKIPAMFELFAQGDRSLARSEGGLGIGLSLVKALAEMHGGSVGASSEGPQKGSEFIVRLPAVEPRATYPEIQPIKGQTVTDGSRILVIEDNVDTARGMAKLLKRLGHDVETAHSGPEALRMAARFRPEFVLLDIGLPGMDGYEVATRLRKDAGLERSIIIAVSGYGQEEDRRRSHKAGFNHHLVKPVDFNSLIALIGHSH